MSEYLSSEAVVLKSQDYKEDDKIITIFGEKTGKLRAVVKGVKKSNSKLRGAVQGFSVTDLTFTKGKVMPIVIAGEVVKSFNGAADDYTKVNYACILSEFVDKAMPEGEIDETIYKTNAEKTGGKFCISFVCVTGIKFKNCIYYSQKRR